MIQEDFMTKLRREVLERFPFFRSVRGYFRSYTSLNSGLIYFQRIDFSNLQPLKEVSPLYLKEMSTNDETQVKEWLNVIKQSFSRNWEEKDYVNSIINHKIYDVLHTYFLMDDEKYIGVVSEAVFKKNKQVGVTHYLGLHKDYLGRGLGKYLILYTLHKMKEHDFKICEGESTLEHKESLFIHFDFGFRPKTELDYWNTQNHAPALIRAITDYQFIRLYKKWKKNTSSYKISIEHFS